MVSYRYKHEKTLMIEEVIEDNYQSIDNELNNVPIEKDETPKIFDNLLMEDEPNFFKLLEEEKIEILNKEYQLKRELNLGIYEDMTSEELYERFEKESDGEEITKIVKTIVQLNFTKNSKMDLKVEGSSTTPQGESPPPTSRLPHEETPGNEYIRKYPKWKSKYENVK